MKCSLLGLPLASFSLAALALAAPQAPQKPEELPLAGAVPEDVFLFTHSRHNTERAFLDTYWTGVWQAFEASGITQDLLDLALSAAGEEEKQVAEHLRQRFGELVAAVDWGGLFGGEAAFAERMPPLRLIPGGGAVMTPDMVVLLRPGPEADVDAIHKGLEALLDALVEEVRVQAKVELGLERRKEGEVGLTTLDLGPKAEPEQGLQVTLGRTGRTLLLCYGARMQTEVVGLLNRSGAVRPILASERMRKAFAELPAAEDGLTYFDMQSLRAGLQELLDQALALGAVKRVEPPASEAGAPATSELEIVRKVAGRLLDSMGVLECSASVETTEGRSTHSHSIALMAADAAQNPIYPVFASVTPVDDFARYLPRETTSFTVDAGMSLPALYTFIQDTFAAAGEPGLAVWKAWEEKQGEIGFDVRKDLLDWLGTASVQASLEVDGTAGWIFLMRVEQDETARKGLDWALEIIPEQIEDLAAKAPQLAMLQLNVVPTSHPELQGFHDVSLPMMPVPMVCGVRDGWMMMGSTQEALLLALHTAQGEHESVRANEVLMAKALVPKGAAQAVSFTDQRGTAKQIAMALSSIPMFGGMMAAQIPDPEAQKVVAQLLRIVGKLGPIVAKIDFYDSTASLGSFDGKAWRTHSVTHYVPPAPPAEPGVK